VARAPTSPTLFVRQTPPGKKILQVSPDFHSNKMRTHHACQTFRQIGQTFVMQNAYVVTECTARTQVWVQPVQVCVHPVRHFEQIDFVRVHLPRTGVTRFMQA